MMYLLWCTCVCRSGLLHKVSNLSANSTATAAAAPPDWRADSTWRSYAVRVPHRPSTKSLLLAVALFLLTFGTCLVAGTHFAVAYAHNEAVSWDEFIRAFTLVYRHPLALAAGLPFALTLLAILLAHELGHFFACRHHHIHSSYPFFIPFPTLIGTLGAFILIRSPIRTTRALFDVGASGPLVGFLVAVPALIYGIVHAKFVPGLAVPADNKIILGSPLILHLLAPIFHHGANTANLLLHPVGRAAWVGLFATSLNLLPAVQLDGGHILRSVSQRAHRVSSILLPVLLALLAYRYWGGWYIWAALLVGIRFLRTLPIYNPEPLGPMRYAAAFLSLAVFILSFMPAPFLP
jgi:membrane-associated protease RseP (regulator of RpoE activity)